MTFRSPAYRAAIKQLADAIATMPVAELATGYLVDDLSSDLFGALERRHRHFATTLYAAFDASRKQRRTEGRKAAARKAAITRAKTKAAEPATA